MDVNCLDNQFRIMNLLKRRMQEFQMSMMVFCKMILTTTNNELHILYFSFYFSAPLSSKVLFIFFTICLFVFVF